MISTKAKLHMELDKVLGQTNKSTLSDDDIVTMVQHILADYHKNCYGDPKFEPRAGHP